MTRRDYIDLIRQQYPDISLTEIDRRIKVGMRQFLGEARIYDSSWSVTTVADQRFYALSDNLIEVDRADYDGTQIGRLLGAPKTTDIS